eukprot:2397798-Prymnesium_polylepis.1
MIAYRMLQSICALGCRIASETGRRDKQLKRRGGFRAGRRGAAYHIPPDAAHDDHERAGGLEDLQDRDGTEPHQDDGEAEELFRMEKVQLALGVILRAVRDRKAPLPH